MRVHEDAKSLILVIIGYAEDTLVHIFASPIGEAVVAMNWKRAECGCKQAEFKF